MKLTIVTEWCGDKCYASSRLNDKKSRIKSCLYQTQEYVLNKFGFIPTVSTIFEHMESFQIDEVE